MTAVPGDEVTVTNGGAATNGGETTEDGGNTVTNDGDDAADGEIRLTARAGADGVCTFDVPRYGTWEILLNGALLDIVNVDTVKQYRAEPLTQAVHYTMFYDGGDECTSITGGWTKTVNNASKKEANRIYVYDQDAAPYYQFKTVNAVDLTRYSRLFVCGQISGNVVTASEHARISLMQVDTVNGYPGVGAVDIAQFLKDSSTSLVATYAGCPTVLGLGTNKFLKCVPKAEVANKDPINAQLIMGCRYAHGYFYHVFATNPDPTDRLFSAAGLDPDLSIDEFLASPAAISQLLSREGVVRYMLLSCTGDFMGLCVVSDAFRAALAASPYRNLVYANEHWAKFLAMVA